MKKKKLIYETPQCDDCTELLLAGNCLISASAENNFIDDPDPYFE